MKAAVRPSGVKGRFVRLQASTPIRSKGPVWGKTA